MKIKKLFPFAASAFFCSLSLSANVLYWVDATSYFNADASGKIDGTSIWNIARDFSSTEKSEYSDNYNWATGYRVKEVSAQDSVSGQTTVYYVPVYEYASTAAVPDENTDVYFKCDDFSNGSDSIGYRYRIAGSISLGADTTVKSINIQRTDDNWLMFRTNGHDLTILEDVVYNSYAVALIGSSSSTNIKVGGNVRVLGSGGLSRYNAFPKLRIQPNETHGTFAVEYEDSRLPSLYIDGKRETEYAERFEIDGILHVFTKTASGICVQRDFIAASSQLAMCEICRVTNNTGNI